MICSNIFFVSNISVDMGGLRKSSTFLILRDDACRRARAGLVRRIVR